MRFLIKRLSIKAIALTALCFFLTRGAPNFAKELQDIFPEPAIMFRYNYPNNEMCLLRPVGFLVDQEVTMILKRPLTGETSPESVFTIDKQNMIHCGELKLHAIGLPKKDYLPGERVVFSFYDKDRTLLLEFPCIPQRIYNENSKKELGVEAELMALKPTVYLLQLEGLENGESFEFRSASGEEKLVFSPNLVLTTSPDVVGKKGGIAKVTVQTKNKKISIDLPWGEEIKNRSPKVKS